MNLGRPRLSIAVVTDDLKASLEFYRDTLGLEMRPWSNAILMFPFGETDFVVCLRQEAPHLVLHEFKPGATSNVHVTLLVESETKLRDIVASLESARVRIQKNRRRPDTLEFDDFNGVSWLIEVDRRPAQT